MKKQTSILVFALLLIPSFCFLKHENARADASGSSGNDDSTGAVCHYPLPVRDGLHPYQYYALAKAYLSDFRLDLAKVALQKLKKSSSSAETAQLVRIIEQGYMPRYPIPADALKELNRAADLLPAARMRDSESLSKLKSSRQQLISKYPNLEWAYFLGREGRFFGGTDTLKKVLQINPNNIEVLYSLAEKSRGDDWSAAYNYARRVKSLDPNFVGLDLEFLKKCAGEEAARKKAMKGKNPAAANAKQMQEAMARMQQKRKTTPLKSKRAAVTPSVMPTFSMGNYVEKAYNFIDKSGKVVIRTGPNVKVGRGFSDGVLVVNASEGRGSYRSPDVQYWDKQGDLKFSLDYGDASSSTEGLCAVEVHDDIGRTLWGFKDHRGKMVIAPQFDEVIPFQDGMAAVRFSVSRPFYMNRLWGFIDKSGFFKVEPIYDHCMPFTEDLAAVVVNGKVGFLNKQGKFAIPPKYDYARPFSEGLANVIDVNTKSRTVNDQYIDKSGKVAFSNSYTVPAGKKLSSYIKSDNYLYAEQYNHQRRERLSYRFSDFHNNLVARWKLLLPGVWKLGYLGRDGKYVIPPSFDGGDAFSEGIARIKVGKQYSYINTSGKRITSTLYEQAADFSDGLAAVSRDGKLWGYLDKTGKEVIPCRYLEAESFSEGLAKVGVAK